MEYLNITDLIRQESIPLSDVSDTLDQLMNLLEGNSSLQHPVYSLLINDTLALTLDCVQPPLQH